MNKNTVPFETRSPFVTSGIRIGTAALTTRGMGIAAMESIGRMIDRALSNLQDESVHRQIYGEVVELCSRFPLYRGLLDN